jgi:2-haloacid dehalogenase
MPRVDGFRLFTLTNNLAEVQTRQLERGGIVEFFDRSFSVESVKAYSRRRKSTLTWRMNLVSVPRSSA